MRRLLLVFLCALVVPGSAAAWTWPSEGPVTRGFSFDPDHPYAAGQHRGIDIGASSGTPVRAPAAGTVTFAGTVPNGGKTISIETPSGYTATLLHLGSLGVARGAGVREGDLVATAGTDSFVYFGLRRTAEPQGYVDPLDFLPPRAGTAPAGDGTPAASPQVSAPPAAVKSEQSSAPATAAAPVSTTAPAVATAPAARSAAGDVPAQTSGKSAQVPAGTKPASSGATGSAAAGSDGESSVDASGTTLAGDNASGGSVHTAPYSDDEEAAPVHTAPLAADPAPEQPVVGGLVAVDAGSPDPATGDTSSDAPRRGRERAGDAAPAERPSTPLTVTAPSSRVVRDGRAEVRTRPSVHAGLRARDLAPPIVATVVALLSLVAAVLLRRRLPERWRAARIMSLPGRSFEQEPTLVPAGAQEDPRRASMAVRERSETSGARRWVRGAGRHLRAVPPLEGQRRADGEWNGRARDAGDGHGRPGRRLAA